MSHIWLPDKPHMRRLELFQERINVLQLTLDGKPTHANLWQVINSGIIELPDRRTDEHEMFLTLAIAVACQKGLTPLDSLCYVKWKGRPARRPDLISRDPKIRKLLKPTEFQHPPVWREWMRHDWERFTCWIRRLVAK